MIRLGVVVVETSSMYEIHGCYKNIDVKKFINIDEFEYNMGTVRFEIWWKKIGRDLYTLSIRPVLYNKKDFKRMITHAVEFEMTYDELSRVYDDIEHFIDDCYTKDKSVFDQDPAIVFVEKHNQEIIANKNDAFFNAYPLHQRTDLPIYYDETTGLFAINTFRTEMTF